MAGDDQMDPDLFDEPPRYFIRQRLFRNVLPTVIGYGSLLHYVVSDNPKIGYVTA
jgi:hypothetical protein